MPSELPPVVSEPAERGDITAFIIRLEQSPPCWANHEGIVFRAGNDRSQAEMRQNWQRGCFEAGTTLTPRQPILTAAERAVIADLGRIWARISNEIIGEGPNRDADLHELVVHIHALQRAIGAQAAVRAFPGEFRLLGEAL